MATPSDDPRFETLRETGLLALVQPDDALARGFENGSTRFASGFDGGLRGGLCVEYGGGRSAFGFEDAVDRCRNAGLWRR